MLYHIKSFILDILMILEKMVKEEKLLRFNLTIINLIIKIKSGYAGQKY